MPDSLPIQYARTLLKLSNASRVELEQDLVSLELPQELFSDDIDATASISVDDYGRLFIHLVKRLQPDLTDDELQINDVMELSTYRMMFLAMAHASNLGDALQRASVYFRRFEKHGDTFHLEQDGEQVCCRFHFTEEASERDPLAADNFDMGQLTWLQGDLGHLLSVSLWHRQCSWFIGNFIRLDRVEVAQEHSGPDGNFQEMFGVPLEYGASEYAFHFHNRYLEFPIVRGETSVDEMLTTFPAELLKFDRADSSVSGRVAGLIGTDFTRELPSLKDVAERLFMTTPTLHRRLRDEGTSFQQLKDNARRDQALEQITYHDLNTAQLAEILGFSDASTFHRAFKKWTGLTPQAYREMSR